MEVGDGAVAGFDLRLAGGVYEARTCRNGPSVFLLSLGPSTITMVTSSSEDDKEPNWKIEQYKVKTF